MHTRPAKVNYTSSASLINQILKKYICVKLNEHRFSLTRPFHPENSSVYLYLYIRRSFVWAEMKAIQRGCVCPLCRQKEIFEERRVWPIKVVGSITSSSRALTCYNLIRNVLLNRRAHREHLTLSRHKPKMLHTLYYYHLGPHS